MERPVYRAGDADDFARLYSATYHQVLFTLTAVLRDRTAAEDCAHEAYVRALKAWPRWKPDAPAEAWIHRIALNVATSYRRHQKLREIGEVIRRVGAPASAPDPADGDTAKLVQAALRRLPRDQAAVIVLRHNHGYSNREIAYALNVAESTIATRLATAKRRLAADLAILRPGAVNTDLSGVIPLTAGSNEGEQ